MKIILSRKGFDSAYGGYSSPIFPNDKMVSLLIPSGDFTKYSDLQVDDKQTYFDLMKQLESKIRYNEKWHELTKDTECHLDPDICREIIQRSKNWKPCFGQIDQAQSQLLNKGVKENDLFLFFGWFKKTILKNGLLQFNKFAPDLHIIFGYLQIGEILQVNDKTKTPDYIQEHCHARDEYRKRNLTNTIYVARNNLTWDKHRPGAGVFKFSKNLILTKKDSSLPKGYLPRSRWDLPDFFQKVKISYHTAQSWRKEGYFQSAAIGQEFVVEDNNDVENWAKQIINNNNG